VAEICLWYLSLQLCLAYATAGVAKALGREWRRGSAIPDILATRSYGHAALAAWLRARPRLTRWVTYSVMAFECLFPLILTLGPSVAWFFVGMGFLFHIVNAYAMGLNRFLWAFPATYPAVLYCSNWVVRKC
jgi:hypothetical protein